MPKSRRNKVTKFEPYWKSDCGRATVYLGDMREVLSQLEVNHFHAVVTDPPYGLEFMGRQWDAPWKNEGKTEVCDEGTDQSHPFRDGSRRVCYGNNRARKVDARTRRESEMGDPIRAKYLRHNVEYVRDAHLYQEWFFGCAEAMIQVTRPGAHLLSFGGTRMWHRMACAIEDAGWDIRDTVYWCYCSGFPKSHDISKAIDKELGAEREVVGIGTAALSQGKFNSEEYGAGGYGYKEEYTVTSPTTAAAKQWDGWGTALKPAVEPVVLARKPLRGTAAQNTLEYGCGGLNINGCRPNGRWPANMIHDGSSDVLDLLPDTGARIFYCAKADDGDRPSKEHHPTVKPLDLMKYLVRLVCVQGGVVLDPFMGSGSTGCAAIEEGMWFVGVEQDKNYADLAVGRLRLSLERTPVGSEFKQVKEKRMESVRPPIEVLPD